MAQNTFSPAYQNVILQQMEEGSICAICGRTEIEHVFEPEKCCHARGFEPIAGMCDEEAGAD